MFFYFVNPVLGLARMAAGMLSLPARALSDKDHLRGLIRPGYHTKWVHTSAYSILKARVEG